MGQNDSKEIQSTISQLQSQKNVSHSQAQKFLHDYHTNDASVKDVTDFDDNRLKLFLKYFVNYKYRATETIFTKRSKTILSIQTNENDFDPLIATLSFETDKIQEKMTQCQQDINSFILYEGQQTFQQMIKGALAEIGVAELVLKTKSKQFTKKIIFKKSQNIFAIGKDYGIQLPELLTQKYRLRKVTKSHLLKEKFLSEQDSCLSEQFFVEEINTKQKQILLMISFLDLNHLSPENSEIFTKVQKFVSSIGQFLDQIVKFHSFYTQQKNKEELLKKSQNKHHVAQICWNVLKIHRIYFDFEHQFFIFKLISENKILLHLTSNDQTFKQVKSKVQELFNKKQKYQLKGIQVTKSFDSYEKKYLMIKSDISEYVQKYFLAITENILQFEFNVNTELKALISSGQSEKEKFLFDQIRQIVEKGETPTLLDVFKGLDSFKQFYKRSYHEAMKCTNDHRIFEQKGMTLQFLFTDEVLESTKISFSLEALPQIRNNSSQQNVKTPGHKKKFSDFHNTPDNISQISSTLNIKLNSKPGTPRSFNIFNLPSNDNDVASNIDIFDSQLNVMTIPKSSHLSLTLKIMGNLEFYQKNLLKNQQKFSNFVSLLRQDYQKNKNPFHNFMHGVTVMHTAFILISMKQVKESLSEFSQFVLVFSALCHDAGHTGFNNVFQIATQSVLAQTYNDASPLQNFHIHRTLSILRQTSCNFIESLDKAEKVQIRKLIISNILNTDVKEHLNVLKRFQDKKNQFKKGDFEDEKIISAMLIHSSDFGGSVKNFPICYSWSQLVNEQFKRQSLRQAELNLPLSPFMINLDDPLVFSKNEMGFLKFMVQPLYKSLDSVFSNEIARKMFAQVNENIQQWENVIKKLSTEKTVSKS